jgi:hypothetical protein
MCPQQGTRGGRIANMPWRPGGNTRCITTGPTGPADFKVTMPATRHSVTPPSGYTTPDRAVVSLSSAYQNSAHDLLFPTIVERYFFSDQTIAFA